MKSRAPAAHACVDRRLPVRALRSFLFFPVSAIAPRPAARRCAVAAAALYLTAGAPSLAWSQGGAAASSPSPRAAAAVAALDPVVVTATRHPVRADELVSEVVVIARDQIEQSASQSLPELLQRAAGVQISLNGGLGKAAGVFVRGTEARHTVLLIDGVRYGSATLGTPVWDALPLDLIDRIEVLKGPASALYGSDAAGGVVQVFTRRGQAGYRPYASLGVGSHGQWRAGAGTSGGQAGWTYAFGVQHTHEQGFSATNPAVPFGSFNPDRDGFRQNTLTASAGLQLRPDWRVDASLLQSSGVSRFDDGPGVDARSRLRSEVSSLGLSGKLGDRWHSTWRVSRSVDVSNAIEASFLPSDFRTTQDQWQWQNTFTTAVGTALAGLERREQRVGGSTAYDVLERRIDAAFVGLNGSSGAHSWQANLRRDDNSQFGGHTTGFIGYGLRLGGGWRVNASRGTSFVAPSFNQLYFPGFSNPALQPESGRNTELGIAWSGGGHEWRLVRFDNRIRGYITNTTQPQNVPRSRIDGWTLAYEGRIGSTRLRGAYDALDPRNELSGKLLPRRAQHQFTLGADREVGAWRLGGTLLHRGDRYDDAANQTLLPAFTTADLYADYALQRDWRLQLRVANLTDRRYETAFGYNQPGRTGSITLRWAPR